MAGDAEVAHDPIEPARERWANMRGPVGRAVAGAVTGLLLVACTADGDNGEVAPIPNSTTEQPPESSEPEEEPDPFAIPDDIDVDYVQRVVDELLPLVTEAHRAAVDDAPQSSLPVEIANVYRAVYTPSMSTPLRVYVSSQIADETLAEEYADNLEDHGETRWVVTDLGDADPDCVALQFDYEFSEQETDQAGIATLLPAAEGSDPAGVNPTPWAIGINSTTDQFGPALDDACDVAQEEEQEFLEEFEDGSEENDE